MPKHNRNNNKSKEQQEASDTNRDAEASVDWSL
jgi:hypothetical protein